jgi:predicted DNA-binding transcriptional regulator AlpA
MHCLQLESISETILRTPSRWARSDELRDRIYRAQALARKEVRVGPPSLSATPCAENARCRKRECSSMTARKADIALTPRLTAYVTREEGAAELRISPSTWDEMVNCGQIPRPIRMGKMGTVKRWRWVDVDSHLRNDDAELPEPYFRGSANGTTKDRKRDVAA